MNILTWIFKSLTDYFPPFSPLIKGHPIHSTFQNLIFECPVTALQKYTKKVSIVEEKAFCT